MTHPGIPSPWPTYELHGEARQYRSLVLPSCLDPEAIFWGEHYHCLVINRLFDVGQDGISSLVVLRDEGRAPEIHLVSPRTWAPGHQALRRAALRQARTLLRHADTDLRAYDRALAADDWLPWPQADAAGDRLLFAEPLIGLLIEPVLIVGLPEDPLIGQMHRRRGFR
jgi:hypothetical protein